MTPQPPLLPALREDWHSALCVAAHPDDLEYGAASAVARWTAQGKQIVYLLVTRGEAGIDKLDPREAAVIREEEERQGAREVGVDVVEFLDHRDGVVEYGLPLRRDIARAIRRHRPDVVFTGTFAERMVGGLLNQADHRAVGLATLDAVRDAGNRWVFPELIEDGLEPWPGVRYICFGGTDDPNCGVDVTGFVDRGVASLSAHRAYFEGLGDGSTDPAQIVRWIADSGGARMGVPSAVLFDACPLDPSSPPPWETRDQNG
ncbi:PIG-L deacetylase family protein [Planotetraspora thailandica]|nr:PIG-L deacetylase family protein [Planotetraspora thailandica]